ncbi:hypothetical protein NET03_09875 [Thermomicrobium sp. CFH 73360]|uniref:hypothetical protein n=1 Tax=Thermomicrobium sp. CFH 73360 TaxID=2951987 RepID=UPI002076F712|nr:hypothetical protein [Thermomicrobium sp. CFH 73360]MCM8746830.1 hypothetical protein [Thermomicrobium sp. CFH 73360]
MAMGLHGTPEQQERLERLLVRVVDQADVIEQLLETVELLAGSGRPAGINAVLAKFDETFSAINRPEFIGMVANAMMFAWLTESAPLRAILSHACTNGGTRSRPFWDPGAYHGRW